MGNPTRIFDVIDEKIPDLERNSTSYPHLLAFLINWRTTAFLRGYYSLIMASERFQRRIERLLDQIEEAADARDWQKVRQLGEDVIVADPGNLDARDFLATAERALSRPALPSETGAPTSSSLITPATTSDIPPSFANGRYQVQKILGEGGKKKVYLTRDTTLNREVAFALT